MPFPLPPDLHWETKVCVPFCAQKALLFPLGIQRARIALAPFFGTLLQNCCNASSSFPVKKRREKGVNTYTRRRRRRKREEGH